MDRGVLAAVQRFPEWGGEIRRLALADTTFRGLCDDLLEAEAALARWTREDAAPSEERQREYGLLVRELADEIAAAVSQAPRWG